MADMSAEQEWSPTPARENLRQVNIQNAADESAGEWLAKTVARATDEHFMSLGGEEQTAIVNMINDLSPYMVYHQGKPLPEQEAIPLKEVLYPGLTTSFNDRRARERAPHIPLNRIPTPHYGPTLEEETRGGVTCSAHQRPSSL